MHTFAHPILALIMIVAWMLPPATPIEAHTISKRTIHIVHPWTFGVEPDGSVAVGMEIRNIGKRIDRLIAASSPQAGEVSLASPPAGTETTSRPQDFAIAPGKSLDLGLSRAHLSLRGFKKKLVPYEMFPVVLTFERAGRVEISVMVEDRAEFAKPH